MRTDGERRPAAPCERGSAEARQLVTVMMVHADDGDDSFGAYCFSHIAHASDFECWPSGPVVEKWTTTIDTYVSTTDIYDNRSYFVALLRLFVAADSARILFTGA